jgi:hypothetical protein
VRPEGLFQWKISLTPSGNRHRELPAYGAVPQSNAPPATCPISNSIYRTYVDHIQIYGNLAEKQMDCGVCQEVNDKQVLQIVDLVLMNR